MKKWIFWTCLGLFALVIVVCCIRNSKSYVLHRNFGFSIPDSATVDNYHHSFNFEDGELVAAKVTISKEDFEAIRLAVFYQYAVMDPSDYELSDANFLCPENSDYPVNIEAYDDNLPWWDLKTEQISKLLYREEKSPFPGFRRLSRYRIYAVEADEKVTLYLYALR